MVVASAGASNAQVTLPFGPTDFLFLAPDSITPLAVIDETSIVAGGGTHLQIEFTLTRDNLNAGDSWATIAFNAGPGLLDFIGNSTLAVLTRTRTNSTGGDNAHEVFPTSLGVGGLPAALFTGNGSAVRVIIDGVDDGLFGAGHNLTFLIDEDASTFVQQDVRLDTVVDFDNSIQLDIRTWMQGHNVLGLTIDQLDLNIADPADADGNGTVGLEDFVLISNNFLSAVPNGTMGDVVANGFVDVADFRFWKNRYEELNPLLAPFNGFPVPEPTALGLAVAALGGVVARALGSRRR